MEHVDLLRLPDDQRAELWRAVVGEVERYLTELDDAPVAPSLDPEAVRALAASADFDHPMAPVDAVALAARGLWTQQLHVAHRRAFGLFNPTPTTMGIAADLLTAAFNPQLAAWAHSPFGAEVERLLVRRFAERFGYDPASADGTFTSGGQEANHTAVVAALLDAFPEVAERGVRALAGRPLLYASAESHHSLLKAARACGLGSAALRLVPTRDDLRLDVDALAEAIQRDRAAGDLPFLVVATAGTTSAGIVDPLEQVAAVAAREGLWLHVDAAWGGAAVLDPELRPLLAGIERADSITIDAHKWLSAPMAAGLFLTRHLRALPRAFRVTAAYIPTDANALDVVDPYAHSMQWSRRFIGLKLYLSLAVAGWDGHAAAVRHQTGMGRLLRASLADAGWRVVNQTALPVVCFTPADDDRPFALADAEAIAGAANAGGEVWLSVTRLGRAQQPVLRACITSFRTMPEDVRTLVRVVSAARETSWGSRMWAAA